MATSAVVAMPWSITPADRERLEGMGFVIASAGTIDAPAADPTSPPDLAAAIRLGAAHEAFIIVVGGDRDPRPWRKEGAGLLSAATEAAAAIRVARPVVLVVIPAASAPLPGPVAVISPAESVSAYELYIGAALAANAARRVEHLNGRGSHASARHSALLARAAAWNATPGWRERVESRPARALHTLTSRPAVVVIPVSPGSVDAAPIIAAHPDADIVLVFDIAHARHGAAVARQVASMVELALGVELSMLDDAGKRPPRAPVSSPRPQPAASALPLIRASDVIHMRLTDAALELTNRTRQRVRLRVALGAASSGGTPSREDAADATDLARAEFETLLEPGDAHSAPTAQVTAVAQLAAPEAVLRHWSHGSAEVYEGGDRRLLWVEITVLDAAGQVHAAHVYDVPNGLDFSLTARDLGTLTGRGAAAPVLPEPEPAHAVVHPPQDLFAAFESALAVGTSVLAKSAP